MLNLTTYSDLSPSPSIVFSEWRPVSDDPGYFVSSIGRVASRRQGHWRILTQQTDRYGYQLVRMGGRYRLVHRLVAMAFVGAPAPSIPDPTVDHIDHRKTNNTVENLRWLSRADNLREAARARAARRAESALQN
jgi:hypothetical protein